MRTPSRPHLTFANVGTAIALLILVGSGSATAAVKNLVNSADIEDRSIQTVDIAKGAITGGKVKDGSLTARDFTGDLTGPRGEVGAVGPIGPEGKPGPMGDQGEPGARGAVGEQGVAGLKGDQGDAGTPGAVGAKGEPGVAGPKGDRGQPGATGAPGPGSSPVRVDTVQGRATVGVSTSADINVVCGAGQYVIGYDYQNGFQIDMAYFLANFNADGYLIGYTFTALNGSNAPGVANVRLFCGQI